MKNKYILRVFEFLNKNEISHILINDFISIKGRDLDIYIPYQEFPKITSLVNRGMLFHRAHRGRHSNHFYFYIKIESYVAVLDVKFQLSFYDPDIKGYRIADFENSIFEGAEKNELLWRPKWWYSLLLYAAHCGFLERQKLEKRHLENLAIYTNEFLKSSLEQEKVVVAENILTLIDSSGTSMDNVPRELRKLIAPYFSRAPDVKIIKKDAVPTRLSEVNPFRLVFVGCDGSGKSTIINEFVGQAQVPCKVVYGGVGAAGWKSKKIFEVRERIKGNRLLSKLGFHTLWLIFLFPIELYFRMKIRLTDLGKLFVFDRYPDFSFKVNANWFVRFLYSKILPVPDLIVFLDAPIETLLERKPNELTAKVAQKKVSIERRILKYYGSMGVELVILDTSKASVSECVNIIHDTLWNTARFREAIFENALNARP